MTTDKVVRLIKCPSCHKRIAYDTTLPCRPFCSERCKTMDTAAWATEAYAIPGESVPINPEGTVSAPEHEEEF